MPNHFTRFTLFFYLLMIGTVITLSNSTLTAEPRGSMNMKISQWLQLGPIPTPLPVYHEDAFQLKDLLEFEMIDISQLTPEQNRAFQWDSQTRMNWTSREVNKDTLKIRVNKKQNFPLQTYLAVYIDAHRWTKGTLHLKSPQLLKVYLDGKVVGSKTTSEEKEPGELKEDITLETGKHLLIVRALSDSKNSKKWWIEGSIEIEEQFGEDSIQLTHSPRQRMNIHYLLETPQITGVSISPDAKYATVTIEQTHPSGDNERWLELRNVKNGKLIETYRGGTALSQVKWAPREHLFAYTQTEKEKTTLWVVDLANGTTTPVLKEVENFGGFTWSPEGTFIIYSITEQKKEKNDEVQHITTPRARWPWFHKKSYLYKLNLPEGVQQRLTAGEISTELSSISPDGKYLLFTRDIDDFQHRPYTRTFLCRLTFETMKVDTLLESGWLNTVEWSPDGNMLLLLGSPELFGNLGVNLPEGKIPNDYDTQAYLFDLETKTPRAISKEFNPTIHKGIWDKSGKHIYFSATDGEYVRLFRYSLATKKFTPYQLGIEVLENFDVAQNKPVGIYYGSSVSTPNKAYIIHFNKKEPQLFSDPAGEEFQYVDFGKVERWTFTNRRGEEIEGRIYYPPDFQPDKTYPCIVYYYGGTVPVTREFGGRYPKNLFAAQGYIVYVLQPSGAIGYGQEFSAYHVNDWGEIVAQEIIDGTRQFLEAHPFVDKKRVGCIGASYGGFMTMNLITKTDMFAAAISHAGISSLSSYWGEGYWGYLYSSVATANSFPWNRKDIYVDRSPLFNADKVNTPLLLLHGDADTNVPRGESDQFYVALKLLGKPVEYVRVKGQDHHIIEYSKRIIWQKTILAWFDKWLKDQPEWWEELYKK